MFVQHMLASLKPDGHIATIMPHGVLFRGGKEKLIRELLINDDVTEAIISLPSARCLIGRTAKTLQLGAPSQCHWLCHASTATMRRLLSATRCV
jgi:N-6 DNA Methylase